MLVGGDATQFSLGLMGVLSRSLQAGRIPWWNDLWGFGFPGVAESQMGVFYPPHLVLYRWLSTEAAYTTSLVAHSYWAAMGAYWAARVFGVSRWSAAFSAIAWTLSGVFLIHLPHQWGYTTGSWMPWAIGLAFRLATDASCWRWAWLLPATLSMQVLPGHFQFAFMTQVAVLATLIWVILERPEGIRPALARGVLLIASLVLVLLLAAMQLIPSAELALSARSQRTVAYLGAFPASPLHLIHYVAPNLFQSSPLWRSFAWDPFHAMPEEHRPYIGLLPMFLALVAVRRGFRRDPATRLLVILALGSLILSLGPYAPGFRWLIRLPGFSFFRAPARWSLLTTLGLAILAGKGLDGWMTWPNPGRALGRFVAGSSIAIALIVLPVVLLLHSGQGSWLLPPLEAARTWMPWTGDRSVSQVVASSRFPPRDPLVLSSLIRQGVEPSELRGLTLERSFGPILFSELLETASLLVVMTAMIPVAVRRHRTVRVIVFLLTIADLMMLSSRRDVELAPVKPLAQQSTLLHRMASMSRGTRSLDPLRNLPMLVGIAPLSAYRTLDRPVLSSLVNQAGSVPEGGMNHPMTQAITRTLGASIRVYDPFERASNAGEIIIDPELARWIYGQWARQHPEQARFGVLVLSDAPTRAWFVPRMTPEQLEIVEDGKLLEIMSGALPLSFHSETPEQFQIDGEAASEGTIIVSVLHDAGWQTNLSPPARVFGTPSGGAWQGIEIAKAGPFQISFVYEGRTLGLWVSLVSWCVWLGVGVVVLVRGVRRRRRLDLI